MSSTAESTQSAVVTTSGGGGGGGSDQYVEIAPAGAFVEVDLDPTFTDTVTDAYLSVLVYIPSSAQADLLAMAGDSSRDIMVSDASAFYVRFSGGNWRWYSGSVDVGANVIFDAWNQFEWHVTAGSSNVDVRINGTLSSGIATGQAAPTGVNSLAANRLILDSDVGGGGGVAADDFIRFDELSWSLTGWVSIVGAYARWSFDGTDPLGDAPLNYPSPPWYWFDAGVGDLTIGSGGGIYPDLAPGETPPDDGGHGPGFTPGELVVTLDETDISGCALEGSVTRRLNRPAQATIKIPMDCAQGCFAPGSRLKISFDSGNSLFFHGMVMDWELDGDEDFGYITMNATDPMELWEHRPARDGPDSTDPGDFSNPTMFQEFPTGPQLLEQMLLQSADDSDPDLGEGPLFLDLGSFAAGGVDLSGAPVDWPMTIAEVSNLLISTGEMDVVITPTDPGAGVMGTVDAFNGNYGQDLTGSVVFEYGTGALNVRALRWNQDMSNITNKLWYFGGPRIETAADPGGNQHWCFNVQGDDPGLPGFPASSPYIDVINCRGADSSSGSRGTYGVRMDIQVFDGASDLCVGPGGTDPGRELYRYLWIAESWARCNPRTLIHVTPVRGSSFLGAFDIGDLVGVTIGSQICGGADGAQRVYQYTISWDADGPFELSELQTSSDIGL